MDWLEYVKGELINKGWSAPKVRANEAFIAAAISIYNSYDGQFDAIVAAEAILRKAKTERTVAQGHNFHAEQSLREAQRALEASKKAEKNAEEYYLTAADYDQSAAADYQAAKQERERLKGLVKVIEKYETEEARDRARLAILFDKMRGSLIRKDDAAYITWLGAILAGYFTKDALEALEESEA